MTNHNYCVILAGGIGSRFWPISRENCPKQFLDPLGTGRTLLKSTWERMRRTFPASNILVVSLAKYKPLVEEQLPELPAENLVMEPYGRSTAPSISLAARVLLHRDPEAVMLVSPSDHHIGDNLLFDKAVREALEYVSVHDVLLTMGVVPTRPDANFGYIQVTGGKDAGADGCPVKVKTFTEKPDPELAKVFIESGEFLWNSGIFVWKAAVIRSEIRRHAPEISKVWKGWERALGTPSESGFVQRAYADSPRNSIDYALMEKSDNVWVLPVKFEWDDLGTWDSLYGYFSRHNPSGNAEMVLGPKIIRDASGNVLFSEAKNKLVVVRGLEDYMVIDTGDVLVVCPRDGKSMQDTLSEVSMPEFADYK